MLDFQFDWDTPTSGDKVIFEALRSHFRDDSNHDRINQYLDAARRIFDAATQAMSIDNLVDAHEDERVTFVAKLAIVRSIHEAEGQSLCARFVDGDRQRLELGAFEGHWYNSLSKLLFEQVRVSTLDQVFANLEIINFNYDRCLEGYLPYSIANYYGTGLEAATKLVQQLPMHRPYGRAGDLTSVKLGGVPAQRLTSVARGIRTFTEQIEDDDALRGIQSCLASADRIVFLGFAFHRQNLKLLETDVQSHAEVLATTYGISDRDSEVIADEIGTTFGIRDSSIEDRLLLTPVNCAQFFGENWRTLTAESSEYHGYTVRNI